MNQDAGSVSSPNQQWLNVEHLAQVEVSSEDAAHPVESALIPGAGPGWQAGQPVPRFSSTQGAVLGSIRKKPDRRPVAFPILTQFHQQVL
jgi:hypothetical protein